eukprot:NODE_55_length_3674_cov_48.425931_g49_i0.p1 GENE.NODE_55_length_3674_cov_48.425931_g49_i0~~NODE_55_length_3674_cov_48.425931_g49_i0.p1  ORF type:complete len:1157 (-),score=296.41 NODE_55_length_3674_cov_48.425931_g49_i0:204-3383(-)
MNQSRTSVAPSSRRAASTCEMTGFTGFAGVGGWESQLTQLREELSILVKENTELRHSLEANHRAKDSAERAQRELRLELERERSHAEQLRTRCETLAQECAKLTTAHEELTSQWASDKEEAAMRQSERTGDEQWWAQQLAAKKRECDTYSQHLQRVQGEVERLRTVLQQLNSEREKDLQQRSVEEREEREIRLQLEERNSLREREFAAAELRLREATREISTLRIEVEETTRRLEGELTRREAEVAECRDAIRERDSRCTRLQHTVQEGKLQIERLEAKVAEWAQREATHSLREEEWRLTDQRWQSELEVWRRQETEWRSTLDDVRAKEAAASALVRSSQQQLETCQTDLKLQRSLVEQERQKMASRDLTTSAERKEWEAERRKLETSCDLSARQWSRRESEWDAERRAHQDERAAWESERVRWQQLRFEWDAAQRDLSRRESDAAAEVQRFWSTHWASALGDLVAREQLVRIELQGMVTSCLGAERLAAARELSAAQRRSTVERAQTEEISALKLRLQQAVDTNERSAVVLMTMRKSLEQKEAEQQSAVDSERAQRSSECSIMAAKLARAENANFELLLRHAHTLEAEERAQWQKREAHVRLELTASLAHFLAGAATSRYARSMAHTERLGLERQQWELERTSLLAEQSALAERLRLYTEEGSANRAVLENRLEAESARADRLQLELERCAASKREDLEAIKGRVRELHIALDASNHRVEAGEQRNSSLQMKLDSTLRDLTDAKLEVERLQTQCQQYAADLSQARLSAAHCHTTSSSQETAVVRLESELAFKNSELAALRSEVEHLRAHSDRVNHERLSLTERWSQFSKGQAGDAGRLEELQRDRKALQEKVNQLQREKEAWRIEIEREHHLELERVRSKRAGSADLIAEVRTLKDQLAKTTAELREEREKASLDNRLLRDQLQEALQVRRQLETRVESLASTSIVSSSEGTGAASGGPGRKQLLALLHAVAAQLRELARLVPGALGESGADQSGAAESKTVDALQMALCHDIAVLSTAIRYPTHAVGCGFICDGTQHRPLSSFISVSELSSINVTSH